MSPDPREHKPSDRTDAWQETTYRMRAETCRLFLLVEGFLTHKEAESIFERIDTWASSYSKKDG